jgi:hypothetical protein
MKAFRRMSLASAALAIAGCSHTAGPGFSASPSSGTSSVTLVDREPAQVPASAEDIKITRSSTGSVKAVPIEPLALPVYPARALAAHAGTVTVTATIRIGKDGRVISVAPSFLGFSTPTKFDSDFFGAVESAAMTWEFQPAWTVPLDPGKDGKPIFGEPAAAEDTFDAVFTFSGSGFVTSGARK